MKRRGKIIATLVTLSLSLAMIVIGVYSASLVSFGISGSIAYEIEDVYVNITTKVYSSDIIANNPNAFEANLVQQYKDMLGLSAFASSELNNGVETLSSSTFSEIDTDKYTLVKEYTYSSLTNEGKNPINDLTFEFNSTNAKTYFIVINVENLSSAPIYAVVQDDKNVPANTVELNNGLQQNILQGEKNRNIVFALGVADFTRPIASGSKFECGIKVGLGDISQTPENLAKLNIAYTDAVSGYTASIKQDAKGVVVVPSTAPVQTRAANDIIAMMPVAQVSSMDEMVSLINLGITHVYLPDTVSIIAPTAFTANAALTKIEGLDNVVSIGDYAFTACVNLAKIDLPDNCASIGTLAFNNCANLYAIDLPNNLSAISEEMFGDCTSLETIDFKNVQNLGKNAFLRCIGLTILNFGNVQSIGEWAFQHCTGLTSVEFANVQSIGEYAFSGCAGLTTIDLGSVKSIGADSFVGCKLSGILTIPNSVEFIGSSAFYRGEFTSLNLSSNLKTIGSAAFSSCERLENVIIPESVTYIENNVFSNCTGLTSVELGGVSEISSSTFSGCTGLTSIDLENVTSIGDWAFVNCTGLTSIDLGSVESIGSYAFRGCTGLTSIDLGSVASIGSYAFERTNLTEITIPSSITSVENIEDAFIFSKIVQVTNYSNLNITLADLGISGNIGAEISKTGTFTNTLVKGDKYTTFIVGNYTYLMGFTNPTQETNANDIPNDVTNIYEYAFYRLDNLTSVTIPDSVTSIGSYAFSFCAGLTSIDLGSVTSINSDAFSYCTGLTSIDLGNVEIIGASVFYGCSGLTSIDLGSVTSINSYAFSYCTGLTSITIPKSVTYITNGVFSHCDGITSIVVDESNTKYTSKINGVETNCIIAKGANNTYTVIQGCKNSTLPYGITSIGFYAFEGCTGLTSIEIPDSVTSISSSAFWACTGLTSIEIPDSVTSIGSYAFEGCTGLTSIEIPDSVTSIGFRAFGNWQQDQSIYFEGTMPENLSASWNDVCYAKIYLNGVLQN